MKNLVLFLIPVMCLVSFSRDFKKEDNVYFYALNIETLPDNPKFYKSRRIVTGNIFKELGILP